MQKGKRFVFLAALVVANAALVVRAQAPTVQSPGSVPAPAAIHASAPVSPTVAAASGPQLDDLERSWLQVVSLSEQLAYSECQRLETVQRFNATLNEAMKQIEARHPGFTLDKAKGVLVAKR